MAATTYLVLAALLASAVPDWTDCPSACHCKWSSGKKTAICKNAAFTDVPATLNGELQVLDLSENLINELPKHVFGDNGLLNLQRIFLSRTGMRHIHPDAFGNLSILVEVDLSHNEIVALHPKTFTGNGRLRVLHLNGNPLRKLVAVQFPPLPHLKMLYLDDCRLEYIDKDAFVHLIALETLSLKDNLLTNLTFGTFVNFNLKTLVLEGNPWRCDCELRAFRDWILHGTLYSLPLKCHEPERLSGYEWDKIEPEAFACAPQVTVQPQVQVQAEAGGNVSFGCRIRGDPEPQVSWLYENHPINHTWLVIEAEEGLLDKWSNISIYNVSEADAGVYTCVAGNALETVASNVTLVLPEVVTATTVSKSETNLIYLGAVVVAVCVAGLIICTAVVVCCVRGRPRRAIKSSVSFTDQEKKLLDVSIATTTDRGTGSCEALGPDLELVEPPVHITIESEPLPLAVYPPPPEFSGGVLPPPAYGNIFISVSVSREPGVDATRCPDLLDLPHRTKPAYHGMATLPRRPICAAPKYDNMGPRVTAAGSSTLSLPDSTAAATTTTTPIDIPLPPPPPPNRASQLTPEFVSL